MFFHTTPAYRLSDGGKHWDFKSKDVLTVSCVSMAAILQTLKVDYINFMLLAAQGAELDVLKSVDWDKVTFDVIAIETCANCPILRPPNYRRDIIEYMASRGYMFEFDMGRNTWFKHPAFMYNSCDLPMRKVALPTTYKKRAFFLFLAMLFFSISAAFYRRK